MSKAAYVSLAILFCLGCSSGSGNDPRIVWSSGDTRGAQRATFYVPLDHDTPGEERIALALIRFPSTGDKKGSVFVNPGGPGGSAVEYLEYFVETDFGRRLRQAFDLLAFDPRGVGQSTAVRCVDNPVPYFAIPPPENETEYSALIATTKEYTAHCAERSGVLLEHVNTMDVVRDMELIRRAVGEGKLNYIGLSYGTKIGALYADEYPLNVRAMVLDGVLPPSLTLLEAASGEAAGFEGALHRFLSACSEKSDCAFGGKDPESALKKLLSDIRKQPLPTRDGRMLTRSEAETGIAMALHTDFYWPWLEDALATASAGDGSTLLAWSDVYYGRNDDGTYTNSTDAYKAIMCADFAALGVEEIYTAAAQQALTNPFFGASFMYGYLPCTFWPVAASPPRVVAAKGAPQIMVVGTTGDPSTSYAWSQSLADDLASSFLVTFHGDQHCAIGSSSCVDNQYERYLLYPDVPYPDADCSKDPVQPAVKSLMAMPLRPHPLPFIRRW